MVERLFKAYFEEEKYISDLRTLVTLGTEAGLTGVSEFLSYSVLSCPVLFFSVLLNACLEQG